MTLPDHYGVMGHPRHVELSHAEVFLDEKQTDEAGPRLQPTMGSPPQEVVPLV